jgi:hypothetical protein
MATNHKDQDQAQSSDSSLLLASAQVPAQFVTNLVRTTYQILILPFTI